MKHFAILLVSLLLLKQGYAQRKKNGATTQPAPLVDSIAFHLYTDSLKKGLHNYINIDGKLPAGGWYPLTAEDILFESDGGRFEGNKLIVPADFDKEKLTITATYKRKPTLKKTVTIYIKILEDGPLKTKEEIMEELRRPPKKNKRGG